LDEERHTVAELLERWWTDNVSKWKPETRRAYARHRALLEPFGSTEVGELGMVHVWPFLEQHDDDRPDQARQCLQTFRRVLQYGSEVLGWLHGDPLGALPVYETRRRERVLDDLELRRCERAAGELEQTADVAVVQLVMLTGLRQADARCLRDRECRGEWLALPCRKRSKPRSFWLPPKAVDLVARWADRERSTPWVFEGPKRCGPVSRTRVIETFAKVRAAAGLGPDVVLHTFRHTHASALAAEGATAEDLQRMFGWSNAVTALRYTHSRPLRARELHERRQRRGAG
jgi:integrase